MPLSAEDIAQIKEELGIEKLTEEISKTVQKTINGALTDHSKRTAAALDKLIEPVHAKLTEFDEKVKGVTPPPGGGDGKGGTQGAPSLDESPVVKGMRKQLDDQKKEIERINLEKAGERTKARNVSLRQATLEHLAKAGVTDATKQRHALALLQSENRVRFESDESDVVVFADAPDNLVDLETGLKSWVKGDDGKHFIPATQTRGSGARPPAQRTGTGSGQAPSKDDALANAMDALDRALG